MTTYSPDEIRTTVREHYAAVARGEATHSKPSETASACCGPTCCGPSDDTQTAAEYALALGYSPEDVAILNAARDKVQTADASPPRTDQGAAGQTGTRSTHDAPRTTLHAQSSLINHESSIPSLGCGNPQAIANLREGETVVDLGAGGGFDCFLAARQVGESGSVIGVDMTPDMVSRARANAAKLGASNVDFRLGEIENLPVADASVDVIMSNCVINLSPDKPAVFREAFRVLKPGGRLAISDVVATSDIPEAIANDLAAYAGCVSGAAHHETIREMLEDAGFADVRVTTKEEQRDVVGDWMPGTGVENHVASAVIEGAKR